MTFPRVASLIASATETVAALGAASALVARSHECDYPASILHLPVVTEPKFAVTGSSAEIDRRVKEVLGDAMSVYRVHTTTLDALRPDVILTQSQCAICAVSLRDVEQAVCEMLQSRPRIVALEPNALADIWMDIQCIAEAIGVPERGESLIVEMQARMREVSIRANAWGRKPSVACIEWIEPLMAAGNWIPELVEMAGGINLFGEAGHHSPWLMWEQLAQADPDVIVVMPCGFDLERTAAEMGPLTAHEGWSRLSAVRNGRVYLTDGNAYFNRPGPRLVEALEMLAEAIQPAAFAFGHDGIRRYE